MSKTDRLLEGAAESILLLLGSWQLLFTLLVRLGADFHTVLWASPLTLVLPAAVLAWREPEPAPLSPAAEPRDWRLPVATLCLAAGLAVAVHWKWVGFEVFWAAALLHLGLLWRSSTPHVGVSGAADRYDGIALIVAGLAAAGLTLALHRPEGDDGFYLNQAVATLRWPDLAVLSFDGMHGDPAAPVQQPAHRAQGFELLVATLAGLVRTHPGNIYYIVLPALFALVSPLAMWAAVRRLTETRTATIAAVLAVPLLLFWGGHYYAFGNFAWARMFQGKGVLVSVALPLVVFAAFRFAEQPTLRRGIVLAFAQAGAAAATSTALIVAPGAAALAVLSSLTFDKRGAKLALGGLASALPVVAMLLLVKLDMDATQTMDKTGIMRDLGTQLGRGWRIPLSWTAWLALPLLAPRSTRYIAVLVLLLLNHQTGAFIADYAGKLYSWRTHWAAPIPILSALAAAAALHRAREKTPQALTIAVLATAWLAAFGWFGDNTFDTKRSSWGFGWVVPAEEFATAQLVVDNTTPDDLALLPAKISLRITSFAESPKLVIVRPTYTTHLRRYYGAKDTAARKRLGKFADEGKVDVAWAMEEFDRRGITVFVTNRKVQRRAKGLHNQLKKRGFRTARGSQPTGEYRVWTRALSAPPAGDAP